MIYKVLLILSFLALSKVNAQMLEAQDGVIELGMGFPETKPIVIYPGASIFHFSGLNPFGKDVNHFGQLMLKGEYLVADKMGFACAIHYGYFSVYEFFDYEEYDPSTASYITRTYFYDTKIHKFRITAGLNFHVLRTERLDSYVGFMAGTKKAILKWQSNDPNLSGPPRAVTAPFAMRAHFGMRFFVKEYFAINMEMGLGGPIISFGGTYKF